MEPNTYEYTMRWSTEKSRILWFKWVSLNGKYAAKSHVIPISSEVHHSDHKYSFSFNLLENVPSQVLKADEMVELCSETLDWTQLNWISLKRMSDLFWSILSHPAPFWDRVVGW